MTTIHKFSFELQTIRQLINRSWEISESLATTALIEPIDGFEFTLEFPLLLESGRILLRRGEFTTPNFFNAGWARQEILRSSTGQEKMRPLTTTTAEATPLQVGGHCFPPYRRKTRREGGAPDISLLSSLLSQNREPSGGTSI
jgi:hypothetical protein